MKKEDKSTVIEQIAATLKEYSHFYLTETSALNAEKTSALRRECFKNDIKMLVVKNAPERIYTLTTATVILRALLKYFGVSNIVVSDFGVKEGYLSLITSGKRKGIETDLSELPALSAEAPKKQKSAKKGRSESKTEALTEKTLAANGAKKEKKRKEVLAENRTEKKNSEEKGDGEKTEIPKKKRGRPRKRPTEGLEAEPRKEV